MSREILWATGIAAGVGAALILTVLHIGGPATPAEQPAQQVQQGPAPIDFDAPLMTGPSTLVCPLSVLFDRREGHGITAAWEASLQVFGREEAVEKLGCELWREGEPIRLDAENRDRAKRAQAEQKCAPVESGLRYVLMACQLKNDPHVPSD